VVAYKNRFERGLGVAARLKSHSVRVVQLGKFPLLPRALFSLVAMAVYPLTFGYEALRLTISLLLRKPDLIVLSQGGNHDGWLLGRVCLKLQVPFVLISHKATDLYWPLDSRRRFVRAMYQHARHVFFVAEQNRRSTEQLLAMSVERASLVRNPFKVRWDQVPEWPATEELRIACVGRLYPKEKGQDLLLRILASPKWRSRPIALTFFGSGEQAQGLAALAAFLELRNVRFAGQVDNVENIWRSHHCLALPSRAEGMPLVLVEAMLSGRVPIVTDVGGHAELIEHGFTGFLADASTEKSFEAALELAWQQRNRLAEIGRRASQRIREMVPQDPVQDFADRLIGMLESGSVAGPRWSASVNELPPPADARCAGVAS
jgi:glycosyltransferase involved in cell wall biosynthesis